MYGTKHFFYAVATWLARDPHPVTSANRLEAGSLVGDPRVLAGPASQTQGGQYWWGGGRVLAKGSWVTMSRVHHITHSS